MRRFVQLFCIIAQCGHIMEELVPKSEYKAGMLKETESASDGQIGAILSREGCMRHTSLSGGRNVKSWGWRLKNEVLSRIKLLRN